MCINKVLSDIITIMDKPTNTEKEFLDKLKLLTKSKDKWEFAIDDVATGLSEKYSSAVTAKVLWLLGEMGLKYPLRMQEHIGKIANYLENKDPKLRERAVNAIGRIGRADKNLVLPYLDRLMQMVEDEADNVRLSFVWACENIATSVPELFCERLKLFYELMQDKSERVRIEAPEMFRVMGKRKSKVVEPYLDKLQWFADNDQHSVVRIHSAGAIRITEKALQDYM